MQQHSGSGDNIAQTGERSIGKVGDGSVAQTGDNATASVGETKGAPPPEWPPMRWVRLFAFVVGVVVLVLTALSVIGNWKVGVAIGLILMGGSGLPTALKLLGIGGG